MVKEIKLINKTYIKYKLIYRCNESASSIARKAALVKELVTLSDLGGEIIYFDNESRHEKHFSIFSCKEDEVVTELYPNIFSSYEQTELILEDMPIEEIPYNKPQTILDDNDVNIIECKICFKQIQQITATEHAASHTLQFTCDICGCRFNEGIKFDRHKENHKLPSLPAFIDDPAISELYFKNKEKRIEFTDVTDFVGYKIFSHKEYLETANIDCESCDKKFKSRNHLLTHIQRVHNKIEFTCEKCNRKFSSENSLNQHLKQNNCTGEFKCLFCEKILPTKIRLDAHMISHSHSKDDKKMYSCDICHKEFITLANVNIHKRKVHEDIKNSLCTICGLSLYDKSQLKQHMMSHSSERPFKCNQCEATFRHFNDVAVHNRLHTGERPFQCKFCDQKFIANTNMTKHLKAKHFEEYVKSRKK